MLPAACCVVCLGLWLGVGAQLSGLWLGVRAQLSQDVASMAYDAVVAC